MSLEDTYNPNELIQLQRQRGNIESLSLWEGIFATWPIAEAAPSVIGISGTWRSWYPDACLYPRSET